MNNHAIVIKADAKAFGAVTALDVRVSNRWQPSKADKRTFGGKPFTGTSECISYHNADKSDAKVFARTRKPNRIPDRYSAESVDIINKRNARSTVTCADLAPIGDTNH